MYVHWSYDNAVVTNCLTGLFRRPEVNNRKIGTFRFRQMEFFQYTGFISERRVVQSLKPWVSGSTEFSRSNQKLT